MGPYTVRRKLDGNKLYTSYDREAAEFYKFNYIQIERVPEWGQGNNTIHRALIDGHFPKRPENKIFSKRFEFLSIEMIGSDSFIDDSVSSKYEIKGIKAKMTRNNN